MEEPGSFAVFFFQAEDGIRDATVTGVQTCALPIWLALSRLLRGASQTPVRSYGGRRRQHSNDVLQIGVRVHVDDAVVRPWSVDARLQRGELRGLSRRRLVLRILARECRPGRLWACHCALSGSAV